MNPLVLSLLMLVGLALLGTGLITVSVALQAPIPALYWTVAIASSVVGTLLLLWLRRQRSNPLPTRLAWLLTGWNVGFVSTLLLAMLLVAKSERLQVAFIGALAGLAVSLVLRGMADPKPSPKPSAVHTEVPSKSALGS